MHVRGRSDLTDELGSSAAEAIFKMDVKMTRKRSEKRRNVVSRSLQFGITDKLWHHLGFNNYTTNTTTCVSF